MECNFMIEKREDETHWDWCQRYAKECPPELVLIEIVKSLCFKHGEQAWSKFGNLTGHGSGVSQAFIERYKPKMQQPTPEAKS